MTLSHIPVYKRITDTALQPDYSGNQAAAVGAGLLAAAAMLDGLETVSLVPFVQIMAEYIHGDPIAQKFCWQAADICQALDKTLKDNKASAALPRDCAKTMLLASALYVQDWIYTDGVTRGISYPTVTTTRRAALLYEVAAGYAALAEDRYWTDFGLSSQSAGIKAIVSHTGHPDYADNLKAAYFEIKANNDGANEQLVRAVVWDAMMLPHCAADTDACELLVTRAARKMLPVKTAGQPVPCR